MNAKTDKKSAGGSIAGRFGYGYFIAAAIFLCNPLINIIDVLPDFFGILFLLKGLQKWADLCPNVADAVAGLQKYRWFMLLKMLAMILVPLSVEDTDVLVLTFGFLVVECIYLIPAISRIFDGMEYFGTRFNGRAIFANMKNVRTLTNIFIVGRLILTLLPELCSLSTFDNIGMVTGGVQINYADYKPILVGFNLILTSLMAILWLVNLLPYIRGIAKETEFLARILHDYDLEITMNTGLKIRRTLRSAITLTIAGFAFFPNLWLDGFNVIPTFVGAIFLAFAMHRLTSLTNGSKWVVRSQVIFAAVSAVSYAAGILFSLFFGLNSIMRDFTAYEMYNVTRVLGLLEFAAMAFSVYMIFGEFRRMILMHLGPDPDVTDRRLTDIYATQQHEAENTMVAGFIGFLVMLVFNAAYMIMRADIDVGYWILPFLAAGIWIVYMVSSLNQLYDQIEYKYI